MTDSRQRLSEKESLKNHAEAFYDVAKYLKDNMAGVRGGAIPVLYLLAHSFELLFKAYLIELQGSYKCGHNLLGYSKKIESLDIPYKKLLNSDVYKDVGKIQTYPSFKRDNDTYDLKKYSGYIALLSSYIDSNGGIRYPMDFAFDFNIFPITEKIYNYIYEKIQ
jgi:hypothetical protein